MKAAKQMQVKNTIYNHDLAQQFPIHIIIPSFSLKPLLSNCS